MENVNEHAAVIQDEPLTAWESVNRERLYFVLSAELILNLVRNCLEVRLTRSRANDEEFRKGRNLSQIEHLNVFGLFV